MSRIASAARTLYNHKKKAIFFSGVLYIGGDYVYCKYRRNELIRLYCLEAAKYGEVTVGAEERPRRVTCIVNKWAMNASCRTSFEETAFHLFNLAGLQVDVIKTENAEQTHDIAHAVDGAEADALFIVGGDGTISNVLTGLLVDDDGRTRSSPLPIGIFPGGLHNYAYRMLSSLVADDTTIDHRTIDTRNECESALALIVDVSKRVNAMHVVADDSTPLIAMSRVHMGALARIDNIKNKYWYYGRLGKERFAAVWNALVRGWYEHAAGTLQYAAVCPGCKQCHVSRTALLSTIVTPTTTERNMTQYEQGAQSQSWFRWIFGSIVSSSLRAEHTKSMKGKMDESSAVDMATLPDHCTSSTTMALNADELLVTNASTSVHPELHLRSTDACRGRVSTMREGLSRVGRPLPEHVGDDDYYNVETAAREVRLTAVEGGEALPAYVDGELVEWSKELVVTAMPARFLTVFHADTDLLPQSSS